MKTDLVTSILAALFGVVVAYLVANALVPAIEPVSFKKLNDTSQDFTLTEPNPEVFNYRALNPTVEVYVGDCTEYDDYGNCIIEEENDNNPIDEIENLTPAPVEPVQENQDGSTN